jgi:ABC-2 type transport system permease protein
MRPYTGTGTMVRLALRRDRVLIPLWAVILSLVVASSVAATIDLYPDLAGRRAAALAADAAPAARFMYGPIHDPSSLGGLATWKMGTMGAVFIAFLAMTVVRRHTRTDEETGRLELVTAGLLGKRATLTAAVIVSVVAVVVTALLTAVGNTAVGLPASSSLAFGATWAAVGIFFTALTALVAQLTQSARACAGTVAGVIGASYALRGVGDVSGDGWGRALSWLSPIGWPVEVRPYAGDRWWVLLVPLALSPLLLGAAFAFQDRRDLGEGIVPTRPGPERASPTLSTPWGLAWRLQRSMLAGWLAAVTFLGLVLGSIVTNVDQMVTPQTREFLEKLGGTGSLLDVFLSVEFSIAALAISGYAIASVLRLGSEEANGHAEVVLATATARRTWYASHTVIALAGSAVLLLVMGTAASLTLGIQNGDVAGTLGRLVPAGLAQVPGVWVVAGLAAALFGLARRLGAVAWAALVLFLLLGELGDLFSLPEAVMRLSPFAHAPRAPAEAITAGPVVGLLAVALALVATGAALLQRRDVT